MHPFRRALPLRALHDRAGRALRAGRKPGLILGQCVVDPDIKALVVALVMAVLSPAMAVLGGDAYDTRDLWSDE